jgi:hypothetical protein
VRGASPLAVLAASLNSEHRRDMASPVFLEMMQDGNTRDK